MHARTHRDSHRQGLAAHLLSLITPGCMHITMEALLCTGFARRTLAAGRKTVTIASQHYTRAETRHHMHKVLSQEVLK